MYGSSVTAIPPESEAAKLEAWRLSTLIEAGYPIELAEKMAHRFEGPDRIDLHQAVELVANGCSHELACEILL